MLAQVHFPQVLSREELDRYLAEGWFRMGQTVFTTNFLNFKHQFYSAIWLRLKLESCANDPTQIKLEKINKRFNVVVQKASIDQEKENLFMRYRLQVTFEPSSSLQALLYGRATDNVYETMEVTVRDGNKLIACGFFDLGHKSTAGITSFYDPDYKKHSLGKFVIFEKIKFSRSQGYEFFYPGYFVPGYRPFDYKLQIYRDQQEYFELATGHWIPIKRFRESDSPLPVMREKMMELQTQLGQREIQSSVLRYEFYDANLVPDLSHMELFDFPVFLQYFDIFNNAINSLVVYDVRDQQYHWMVVKSIWKSDIAPYADDVYVEHLLKVEGVIMSTSEASAMADVLVQAIRTRLLHQSLG